MNSSAASCGKIIRGINDPPRPQDREPRRATSTELIKRMLRRDPGLKPYAEVIRRRLVLVERTEKRLTGGRMPLADFACRTRVLRPASHGAASGS
ncbi:MAG: hypothetical protein MZV70_35605 [Desulfobacterales bacterium]|nr:hypothetical protein [Desulfobacterales bacterium]